MNTKQKSKTLKNNLDYTLFSWTAQQGLNPIDAVKADGVYVYDRDGKQYIDFSSQLMNVNVGHNNTKIKDAIIEQLHKLTYVFPGIASDPRGELGKKLNEIAPDNMQKTFFTNGGADAIENAIKVARLVTGKHKIITRYRSYHGGTYGAITAGGDPRKLPIDRDQMPGIVHVEDPYCYRCPWGKEKNSCKSLCTAHVERIINFEGPENVAAILMEGESGSSGCIKYPPGYWKKIADIAKKHNILIISDEVMSGFGRCGDWFAINNAGIKPDMIVMAKGINSGYIPLGGLMVSKEISNYFDTNPLPIGLTYSGHALACASAIANIDFIKDNNLLNKSKQLETYLIEKVEKLKEKHNSIGDFRCTGLLGCIELVKNRNTKEPLVPWNAKAHEMGVVGKISSKLRERGLITFVRWNWIFIAPPLTITKQQLDDGLDIISEALVFADEMYQEN
jgi:taurine---2-oxoglutarate transaminase